MVKTSTMTSVIASPPDPIADPNCGRTSANTVIDAKNPEINRACPSRMRFGSARGPYIARAGPNIKAADKTKNAIARS